MKQSRIGVLLFAVIWMLCVIGAVGSFTVSAATSGYYTYTVSGGEATIADYRGNASNLTIPSTLGGYPVTSIGDSAFDCCFSLTSITIPNSVTSIGNYAFRACDSLISITIPDGVTSIGGYAFSSCTSLTSITIPDSVTSIGDDAFIGCDSLTSVTIPGSVTSIGYSAFYGCSSLTSITIPDSVTSIGGYAFYGCSSLTSITIPNSVTSIGYGVFSECESLTSITIPNSVTSIGDDAFYYCRSLTSITIPNSVTSIGGDAFCYCTSLKSITIPNSVTSIGDEAFEYCWSLTSITIPNSVTSIGDEAFSECTSLTSVTIPDSVTSIGSGAFVRCSKLTAITVNSQNTAYTSVDGVLFNKSKTTLIQYPENKSGKSYSIPDGVTSIGDRAFYECDSLTNITIPDGVTSIGDWAFSGCDSFTSVTISDGVTSIGEYAFSYCDSLTSITIPNSVTSIGRSAFSYCDSLTSITIPNSVTSIGEYVFCDCDSLTSITIPNSVTSIGYDAFVDCDSLTSITIPDGVTSIGGHAFYSCDSLTSITIGSGVTSIRDYAFYKCSSLTTVYYNGTESQWNAISVGSNNSCLKNATIYYGVSITTQPKSVSVINGATATVTVKADGAGLAYQWYYKDKGESKFTKASGCTAASYSVTMSDACDGRQVYCVVTDVFGNSVASDTVTVNMMVTIITQPQSVGVKNGATATVTVKAVGTGLKYQWYYKDNGESNFTKASGSTAASYSVTMSDTCDGRQVYCVVTDVFGNSVTSSTVTLDKAVSITNQPQSAMVKRGATATVTVKAVGTGLKYQWYYKDDGESKFTKASGCTAASYSVTMSAACDVRQVYCVITDKYGNSAQSNTVTIGKVVTLLSQPKSVGVKNGATATVTVKADGAGLKYQWYYKNKGASGFKKASGYTAASYSVTMNDACAGRQVYCVVTDKYGNSMASNTATLDKAVTITAQPKSVGVKNGATASVSVKASGVDLTYQWYYKSKGATVFTYTKSVKGNTYAVAMSSARAGRQVYCVVTDKYGNSVQSNTVTLDKAVTITTQPKSVGVKNGVTASVSVKASGAGLTYKWYYKGKGVKSFTYTKSVKGNTYAVAMSNARAGRQVYCVVTDKYGNSVTSNTATLDKAVTITTQPKSVAVKNGAKAKITLNASGVGLKYQWYYKDKGAGKFTKASGCTKASYSITMSKARAERQVYCVVTDKYGNSVTSKTVVLKNNPVKIKTQPKSLAVKIGATASVTVKATGDGLTYKWYYRDDAYSAFKHAASSKSSTYSMKMTNARAGRQVYCVVTDKYGNSLATDCVSLDQVVRITKQPKSVKTPNGTVATVSVDAVGEDLTFRWLVKRKGESGFYYRGNDCSEYSFIMDDGMTDREVYCVITDKYGNVATSKVVTMKNK